MGLMSNKHKATEEEIDDIVAAQADDDAAWEQPVRAQRAEAAALLLPSELATRAAFFARLHRAANVEDWVKRIVQERIDMEEAAFAELKRDLVTK